MNAHDSSACGLVLLAAGHLFGCGTRSLESPGDPPNVDRIRQLYEIPNAPFQEEDLAGASLFAEAAGAALGRLALEAELDALLDTVAAAELDSEVEIPFEAGGFIRVTRICAGWGATPTPDREQNGALLAIAPFTQGGIDELIWADVERCRYRAGEARVELTPSGGDFGIAILSGDEPVGESVSPFSLFVLRLGVEVDGVALDFVDDFRVVPSGVEFRFERGGRSLVVRTDSQGDVHVRAANGAFLCEGMGSCREEASAP